ncbi:HTH-type transcriptional regulator HdfR [Streptomyces sp. enrichment culture]
MDVRVRDLRYFLTVAEELRFTRAAERLYVSRPALSKQVRPLERKLGAEPFRRGRRGVTLTEAGRALLPRARRVLEAWAEGAAVPATVRAARHGTLVVGMSTGPDPGGLLPAIRSRFTTAHPDVDVRLRRVSWDDPTAGLADGEADVAFVWLPLPGTGRYAWTVVAEEPRLVALPGTHPWPPAPSSTSPSWRTSRSPPCRGARASCATSGSRPPSALGTRHGSARRSRARRRRTRPWSRGWASAWSRRGTLR